MEAIATKEVRSRAATIQCWCLVGVLAWGLPWGTGTARAGLCQLPDNGSKTINLPPACSAGYSNIDFPVILTDGLPEGGALQVLLSTGAFSGITRTPQGENEIEQANFSASLNFAGTGTLSALNHFTPLSAGPPVFKTRRIGPASDDNQQIVSTEVLRMTGATSFISSWFQSFTIQGGSEFGFNSPGELTVDLDRPGTCVGGAFNLMPCAREDQCPDSNYGGTCQGGGRNGLSCSSPLQCPGGTCLNPGACLCSGVACPSPTYLTRGYYDVTMTISWVTKSTAPLLIRNRSGSQQVTMRIQTGAFPTMYMQPVGGQGREITVRPSDIVTIEVYARDIVEPRLASYQVTLPSSVIADDGISALRKWQTPVIRPSINWVFFGLDPTPLTMGTLSPDPSVLAFNLNNSAPPFGSPRYLGEFTYQLFVEGTSQFSLDFVAPGTASNSRTALGDEELHFIAFQHFGAVVKVVLPSCETGCDDGWFCNGTETCIDQNCVSSGDPCASGVLPVCDEATDACVDCLTDFDCDDGQACTIDSCDVSTCRYEFANALTFEPGSDILDANRPVYVGLGDMDGDDRLDVVWTNQFDDSVAVAFGAGDGTFQDASAYPVGDAPLGAALVDLDSDGDLDVVCASQPDASIFVLYNRGDGTLEEAIAYVSGFGSAYVAVADLDLDGDPDLGVSNISDHSISVFLNRDDGALDAPTTYLTGTVGRMLSFADVDGDSLPDMVYIHESASKFGVCRNVGGGVFESTATTTNIAPGARWLDTGDMDNDGDVDIAIVHGVTANQAKVTVALNGGDGVFDAAGQLDTEFRGDSLKLFDADGDGDLDIAMPNYYNDRLSIVANEGAAAFGVARTIQVGDGPRFADMGDLDGDGLSDIVVTNLGSSSLSVLLNDPKWCGIDAQCYELGEENPNGTCQVCDPLQSREEWTFDPECAVATCETTVNVGCGQSYAASDEIEPDDDEAGCHPNSNRDTWFLYTAECTGTHVVSTAGSTFVPVNDTVLSVFDECGGTEIACNDNKWPGMLSEVRFQAVRGETYYIRVAGAYENAGAIVLNIGTVGRCLRTAGSTPITEDVGKTRRPAAAQP